MVLALVGDSTMTSEPPLVGASACASGSAGAAAFTGFAFFGFAFFGFAFLSVAFFGFASVGSASCGNAFFFFTTFFLAATSQPFVNGEGVHLYHPAPCRASRTTSAATCCGVLRSVSTFASALV